MERAFAVYERFKRALLLLLLAILGVILVLALVDVIGRLVGDLRAAPWPSLVDSEELLNIFGLLLLLFIGLEFADSVKAYIHESEEAHVRTVFLVALTALSRKVIVLDIAHLENPQILYGLAALIVALGVGYYVIKGRDHTH